MSRNSTFNPLTSKRRVFFIELYPDSTSYDCDELLKIARGFPEYAIILHDKDVNYVTGECKKPHYHIVVRCTPTLIGTISNKFLGLENRFIEVTHEFRWCIRYLIHLDDINKYQYPHDAVESNISDIESYWRISSEWALVHDMINLRQTGSTWYQIFMYAGEHQCYDVLRRNIPMIKLIASESDCIDYGDWDNL